MTPVNDLDGLILAYLHGRIDDAEMAALDQRLTSDPAAAARLAWWCRQDLALHALAPPLAVTPSGTHAVATHTSRRHRRRPTTQSTSWRLAAAALVLIAVGGWWMLRAPTPAAAVTPPLAVIREMTGESWRQHGDGRTPITSGERLQTGDVLTCTRGHVSFAYADGTVVAIGSDSVLMLSGTDEDKRLRLDRGGLRASVAPQTAGRPMRFATSQAEATVLGTELAVIANNSSSWLEVDSGRVHLRRTSDDAAVDVAAGQRAVVAPGVDLAARTRPDPAMNLAERQPTSASSTYALRPREKGPFTPDQANDGDPQTNWASRDRGIAPDPGCWWQVDLGLPCRLRRVELVARQDEFDQRKTREGFEVRGSSDADGATYVVLARHQGPAFAHHGTWTADITVTTPVRFVRVTQLKADYSCIAELRVFGDADSGVVMPPRPAPPPHGKAP